MLEGQPYDIVGSVPFTRAEGIEGSKLYLVNTMPEWRAFYAMLMAQKLVACDTETSGFYWFGDHRIVGLSFGWREMHFYVPLRHELSALAGAPPEQLDMDDIREDLRAFFAQDDVFTIWHNWKFDAHFYRVDGIEILTPFHDTRILWQLFDENAPGALKTIASGWKDKDMGLEHPGLVGPDAALFEVSLSKWRGQEATARRKRFRELVADQASLLAKDIEHQDKGRNELKLWVSENVLQNHPWHNTSKDDVHYGVVPVELMVSYAATDTFLTWRVYTHVMQKMPFNQAMKALYINEIKLSRALLEAECVGVKVDRVYLEELGAAIQKESTDLELDILAELGQDVNLGSPTQLGYALRNHGVPLISRTAAGGYKTDAKVLAKFKREYPIIQKILDLRKMDKIRQTYVVAILSKLTPDDILHCSFNQNVSTGRMSSRDPNMQNIPAGDTRIRRAFISPGPEWVYVFADYSQVEVRLTAHYSSDRLLLDAYKKGQDVHTRTMCEMFGYDYDEVVAILKLDEHPMLKQFEMLRTIAKRINFGIIYGVGAPGLSEQIPRPDQYKGATDVEWIKVCQDYIDQYLGKYLGVKRFVNSSGREIRQKAIGYNYFGRPRRLPWAKADKILGRDKYWMVGRAQRQFTNFLIQGTAADLFKIAVVRVFELLRGFKSKIVNFVHDEIQMYVHISELQLLNKIRDLMEDFNFIVPITVDVGYTKTNWAEKKKLH